MRFRSKAALAAAIATTSPFVLAATVAAAAAGPGVQPTATATATSTGGGTGTATGTASASATGTMTGTATPSATGSATGTMTGTATPSATGTAGGGAPFGPGCASISQSTLQSLSTMTVGQAAATLPDLSTVVTALQTAGLANTLDQAQNITVFAPVNSAFQKIPPAQLQQTLSNPSQLKQVLNYHVVPQILTQANLAGSHKTLQGSSLLVKGSGQNWTVNNSAKVICGNIKTKNASVYLIDTVLQPPTATGTATPTQSPS